VEEAEMRKLVMWNMMTLDGYFEGTEPWSLDFHELVWGEELERFSIEQLRSMDAMVFGRRTYEGMARHWTTAKGEIADFMNSLPKVVFSRTLESADWNNSRLVRDDAAAEIAALKRQPGKDLYLFGSADLAATFVRAGLFDEYRICLVPVLLGAGNPLFKGGAGQARLERVEARPLAAGGMLLRYRPRA
jgi:dihydrofolate reductase